MVSEIQWNCGQCNTPFEVDKVDDIVGDRPDHSTAEEGKDGVQYCSKECRAKAMFDAFPCFLQDSLKQLANAVHALNDVSTPLNLAADMEDWNSGMLSISAGSANMNITVNQFLQFAEDLQRELGGEHDYPEWAR